MDEARLGQQLLRCRLVIGHGVRREVLIEPDAPAFFVPTARMDGQALKIEEDLDLVLSDLDPQLLVPVDVRCAVIVAIDADVAVSMQLRFFPLAAVELDLRKRLQRRSFQRFEAIAPRDAEAGVAPIIDPLDALIERLVNLRQRGQPRSSIAEALVAHQQFHTILDQRLISSQQLLLVPRLERFDSRSPMPFTLSVAFGWRWPHASRTGVRTD